MRHRANILGRLRRWNTRAARPIIALLAVAYVAAGAAPCAAVPSEATAPADLAKAVHDHAVAAHERHARAEHESRAARHEQGDAASRAQHGHEGHGGVPPAPHDTAPAPARPGSHCPHCPDAMGGTAGIAHGNDHASCAQVEDLTNVAAAQAKASLPPLAIPLTAPAFTLPPSLASPRTEPQSRAVRASSVPLNVRHCVFLI